MNTKLAPRRYGRQTPANSPSNHVSPAIKKNFRPAKRAHASNALRLFIFLNLYYRKDKETGTGILVIVANDTTPGGISVGKRYPDHVAICSALPIADPFVHGQILLNASGYAIGRPADHPRCSRTGTGIQRDRIGRATGTIDSNIAGLLQ